MTICAGVAYGITAAQIAESGRKNGLAPGGAPPGWNEWGQDATFEIAGNLIDQSPGFAANAFDLQPNIAYRFWELFVGTAYDIPDWFE